MILRAGLPASLRAIQKEWINFDIKESKSGNLYAEVNTWEPEKQDEKLKEEPKSDSMPEWMKG